MVVCPALTCVTNPVLNPTVATCGALLVYVTAPLLSLVATTLNEMSIPNVLDSVASIAVLARVVVPRSTVSVLLVIVALINCPSTAACVALKLTSPAPTKVIKFPEASMVATAGLLLL